MFTSRYSPASVALTDIQPRESNKYSDVDSAAGSSSALIMQSDIDSAIGGEISNLYASIFGTDSALGDDYATVILTRKDSSVGSDTSNLYAFPVGTDSATGSEVSDLLAYITNTDSAIGSSSPIVLLDDLDSAVGDESPTILLGATTELIGGDSATGEDLVTKLFIPVVDSATTSESPVIYLDDNDFASSDDELMLYALIDDSDSATGTEEVYNTIHKILSEATGSDEVTELNSIADLIVRLEGQEDIEINLLGEYDIDKELEGLEDIEINLEGEL